MNLKDRSFRYKIVLLIGFLFLAMDATAQQKPNPLFSVHAGYYENHTAIDNNKINPGLVGSVFGFKSVSFTKNIFFGLSRNIAKNLNLELSYVLLSNNKNPTESTTINGTEFEKYSTSKGFLLPLTINHYFREKDRLFRPFFGVGTQYQRFLFRQYSDSNVAENKPTDEATIHDFQVLLRTGIQHQIIPNLFARANFNIGLSKNNSYAWAVSLKYSLQ